MSGEPYYTDAALAKQAEAQAYIDRGEQPPLALLVGILEPRHPESTVQDRIEALPETSATKSRDYGRGYAQAVRDVLDLLRAHDPSWLSEDCACDPETVALHAKRQPSPSVPSADGDLTATALHPNKAADRAAQNTLQPTEETR